VAFENANKTDKRAVKKLFDSKIELLKTEIPSDEQFLTSFKFKSTWTSKAARYVLSRIELSKGTGETLLNSKTLSLEHIFPKSPSEESIKEVGKDITNLLPKTNSIGNFTLILGKWNQTMSNKPYSYKNKTFYHKSDIKITNELSTIKSWNSKRVEERCEEFGKICLALWNPNRI